LSVREIFLGRRLANREVLIPELVKQRWYQRLLHTHRAKRFAQNCSVMAALGLRS
jgi:hypothetical protein